MSENNVWRWIKTHQYLIYLLGTAVISAVAFTAQSYRMSAMEDQLKEAQKKADQAARDAQHRTLTAFAFGIRGLKETAMTLEIAAVEQREHNILLVEHCKKNNCGLPATLGYVKSLPPYTKPTDVYFDLEQKMREIDTELEQKEQ